MPVPKSTTVMMPVVWPEIGRSNSFATPAPTAPATWKTRPTPSNGITAMIGER